MYYISNLTLYNNSMRKTINDKLFFLDKIDATVIVDFGCGDGTLLRSISTLHPEYTLIGYDNNISMLEVAQKYSCKNIIYFYLLPLLIKYLQKCKGVKCLVLSSVIHEVYSYSSLQEVGNFYSFMYSGLFDYICIRDMMPSKGIEHLAHIEAECVRYALQHNFVPTTYDHLLQFENIWGSIDYNKNLYHFLLKYRYLENWNREVNENYFPIFYEDFLDLMPHNFSIMYRETTLLPYFQAKVLEDFHIYLDENTHIKLIIRK